MFFPLCVSMLTTSVMSRAPLAITHHLAGLTCRKREAMGIHQPRSTRRLGMGASVPALQLTNVSKSFGAIRALNDIDLTLEAGEVLGLMGDNGAGKSTLVKIIAGNFPPTTGRMVLDGEPVHFYKAVEARQKGIEIVYQDLALCDNLTAAANVFLGRESHTRVGLIGILNYRAMYQRAGELFAELRSETRPRDMVRRMSGGQRQAVAIARTRLSNSKIVLLDEPTAAISVRQVAQVLDLIRRLRDSGIVVVLISHRMPDVFAVCDRVCVLRRGRKVAEKPIAQSSPEEITGLITGAIRAA
jgi:simple sugar transport system ATP-binding protein